MVRLVGNMLVPRQSCCQSEFPEEDDFPPSCWLKAGVMEKRTGSQLCCVALFSPVCNISSVWIYCESHQKTFKYSDHQSENLKINHTCWVTSCTNWMNLQWINSSVSCGNWTFLSRIIYWVHVLMFEHTVCIDVCVFGHVCMFSAVSRSSNFVLITQEWNWVLSERLRRNE